MRSQGSSYRDYRRPPAGEPNPTDFILPTGHDWIVPQNGDAPYTVKTNAAGRRIQYWDPDLKNYGPDPPPIAA